MLGYILATIALLTWGLVVIPVKKTTTSGLYGVGISMIVGFTILLFPAIFVLWRGGVVFPFTKTFLILLMGVCQFPLGTAFYYQGIKLAGASVSAPLTRLKPILIGLIVFAAGLETLTLKLMIATVMVALGTGALVCTRRNNETQMKETKKGIVFALAACLCWTIGDILVKQIQGVTSNVHPILLTEIALLGGLLTYFFVIFLIKKQDQVFQMAWGDKKRYALHGLLSLAIAYLAFFASIGMIGLMPAVIITTAWPIASMVVGFFYLKEEFTFLKLVGGGMVTASIYLVI